MAEIAAIVEGLEGTDVSACAGDDLDALVAQSGRVRSWLDAFDTRVAKRNREVTGAGRAANTNLLSNRGRRSSREAREAAGRAETCEQLPQLADALERGECSAGHVDAVTRATAGLDDTAKERVAECGQAIAAAAKHKTPEQLEREVRDLGRNCSDDDGLCEQERKRKQRRVRRWTNRETGLRVTQLELDDETDAKVWTAIGGAVGRRRAARQDEGLTFDQLQADAVVDLLLNGGEGSPAVPEVTVLIDWLTLREGAHEGGVCETGDGVALPVETVRRLCCDADVVPVVLGGRGEVLDLGRSRRTASREQRRALRAMYQHCAFPGCTVGFEQCRIHHVRYWFHDGCTDLDNLLPLCERHHHAVHEGGFVLELFAAGAGRRARITSPTGRVIYDGPSVSRTPVDTITPPPRAPEAPPGGGQPPAEPARSSPVPDSDDGVLSLLEDGFGDLGDDCDDELARLTDADLVAAVVALLEEHAEPGDWLTIAVARGYLESNRSTWLPDDVAAQVGDIYRRHRRRRATRTEPARPVGAAV